MKRIPKDRVVTFRVTAAEHDQMAADAARAGRTLTDHIRSRALDLDRTALRWNVDPASKSTPTVPAMMVWHDGTAGQTWPEPSTTACR